MTVLLIACGTSTLKSPLLRAFFTPHVHSRLRKRLSRCTLDCGFKTSESPALRGFVAGPWALATAALYLVLKSNGLPRPKIRLKKFDFSSKSVPAIMLFQTAFHRVFQLRSQTAYVRFHERKRVYTLGFRRKIAHSGSHGETGAFPPSSTARPCTASEIATERTAGESGCTPYGVCPLPTAPQPRWAALPRLQFGGAAFFRSAFGTFCMCEARGVSPLSACSTCRRNARCPLVKAANSPFPCLARFFFDSSSAKYYPFSLEVLNFYKTHP